jgi:putative PIN family toxin of toxin-antitoxin system
MRVVLDTNVWLDWLVFHDRGVAPLKAAHAAGGMEIIRSLAGEQELERVLAYDALKRLVDAASRPVFMQEMRAASTLHDGSTRAGALPTCRDPDDQAFLELARDCGAALLVSKDRDLLELRRAKFGLSHSAPGFRIVTPQECAALLPAPVPASVPA